jgi:hypothetical protein
MLKPRVRQRGTDTNKTASCPDMLEDIKPELAFGRVRPANPDFNATSQQAKPFINFENDQLLAVVSTMQETSLPAKLRRQLSYSHCRPKGFIDTFL